MKRHGFGPRWSFITDFLDKKFLEKSRIERTGIGPGFEPEIYVTHTHTIQAPSTATLPNQSSSTVWKHYNMENILE